MIRSVGASRVAMAALALGLASASTLLTPGPAGAVGSVEHFCTIYAAAAMETLGEEQRAQCGYSGARWDTNSQNHYNACMNWGAQRAQLGVGETNARAQDLA